MATAVVNPQAGAAGQRRGRRGPRAGSRLTIVRRALLRSPGRVVGAVIILVFLFGAIAGPWFYPARLPVDANAIYAPPSAAHPLGTDFEGTDVLALVVVGARYVLLSAAVAGVIAIAIGVVVGLAAGYLRRVADSILSRLTDFVLTVPSLPLLVILAAVLRFTSPWLIGVILGVTGWAGLARAVRSQALSLRERPFVEASRGLGLPVRHVLARELLPNIAPYVAMNLLVSIVGAIYAETGLFFLGVLPATVSNWGVMLNLAVFSAGAIGSSQALFYLLAPLVAILLLTLGIVLVLDAVDEIFNPRLRA
jgi:peptide/nickel transport system permease protein